MAPSEKTRSNPIVLWTIVLLIAIAIVFAIRRLTRDAITVRVASVSRKDLSSSTSTNGKVEPIHEFQAYAPAPGVVQRLYVGVGDKVSIGTLLVKMDDSAIRAQLAAAALSVSTAKVALESTEQSGSKEEQQALAGDISRAKLQRQQAASDLAALKLLQQKGAASASEVASAQARLDTATSTLDTLQARTSGRFSDSELARARQQLVNAQAEQAAAETNFAAANIRSPISGTVYSEPVSQYDFVHAGDELLDVADLNLVQVRAYFDEPEIGKLANDQQVRIVWDAKPDLSWHGHIVQVPTTVISYGTRNVGECLIAVDDARGDLLPNTNVTVYVTLAKHQDVLSVPREALHTDGPLNFVYRVVHHKLVRTPVQLGTIINNTSVEIVSGLNENDVVALSATNNRDLANGLAVKNVE
jgi:HlyD family secretion protein